MEAVKKFSRINVSIAAICCSPAAFMYLPRQELSCGVSIMSGVGDLGGRHQSASHRWGSLASAPRQRGLASRALRVAGDL